MIKVKSSTPKGTEGFGVSYSDELRCAKELQRVLPEGWRVVFQWAQILFADVEYEICKKEKVVNIVYNQNLNIWYKSMVEEIGEKLNKKTASPEVA